MERFQFATLSALLTGIAFAGAVIEAIGLFSHERIGFELLFRRGRLGLLALPLLIMTGPFIILRDLWTFEAEGSAERLVRHFAWIVVVCWAIASGHLLLRMIEGVQELLGV